MRYDIDAQLKNDLMWKLYRSAPEIRPPFPIEYVVAYQSESSRDRKERDRTPDEKIEATEAPTARYRRRAVQHAEVFHPNRAARELPPHRFPSRSFLAVLLVVLHSRPT